MLSVIEALDGGEGSDIQQSLFGGEEVKLRFLPSEVRTEFICTDRLSSDSVKLQDNFTQTL